MQGDAVYFRHRATEERAAAETAGHPAARQAHIDMAERYEDLATSIAARETQLGLDTPLAAE